VLVQYAAIQTTNWLQVLQFWPQFSRNFLPFLAVKNLQPYL